MLLIDDVQFLERKAKTEEEFFHTFNALYDAGAQVVLTSDRLPRDLAALEDRLRERFEAGLVTDIAPPRPRRCAPRSCASARSRTASTSPTPRVLDAIAERIHGSVRELEGALIRVVAYASLTGRPLDADLADEVLGSLYPGPPRARGARRRRRPSRASRRSSASSSASPPRSSSRTSRAARIAGPRQLAMYLARTHTKASLPGHRRRLRRPQPHDRHARRPQDRGAAGHRTRMWTKPFGP